MTVTERFATSRYYCLMPVYARGGLTLTFYVRLTVTLPANAPEECYMPHK